jgi:hypothetical protein
MSRNMIGKQMGICLLYNYMIVDLKIIKAYEEF